MLTVMPRRRKHATATWFSIAQKVQLSRLGRPAHVTAKLRRIGGGPTD
jgi:hypothetical protein